MKPLFASVANGFPSRSMVPPAALFAEIGWDDQPPAQQQADDCAVRISMALLKAGTRIPGRINVSKGRYRGLRVEPGPVKLSLLMTHPAMLGQPERFKSGQAAIQAIGARHGIVSYWQCDDQGVECNHIELVEGARASYGNASEVWFWQLA